MFLIILSTALHYSAIIPINNRIYINTILYSTTVGILWLIIKTNILLYIDYFLTLIWFFQDILLSKLIKKSRIIYLNIFIFLLSVLKSEMGYNYVWICNILSVIKCIYVSYLINKSNVNFSAQTL